MNGFTDHGLDEGAFKEKGNVVKAFDAFRKEPSTIARRLNFPLDNVILGVPNLFQRTLS